MKDVLFALHHLTVMTAKLVGDGGVRTVIAENLTLKQQLIVLRRARKRALNLRLSDRLLCGFGSLFLRPGRLRRVAIAVRPLTLLAFHQALVGRKYHRLFSSSLSFARNDLASIGAIEVTHPPQAIRLVRPEYVDQISESMVRGALTRAQVRQRASVTASVIFAGRRN